MDLSLTDDAPYAQAPISEAPISEAGVIISAVPRNVADSSTLTG